MMKKFICCLLATLGLTTACGEQAYEDMGVEAFAQLVADSSVVVLDVRTDGEFSSGHLLRALNIDVKKDDFLSSAKALLPANQKIAVYCRSGRRSANACEKLAAEGYQVVNLKGGIMAWQSAGMPVTAD